MKRKTTAITIKKNREGRRYRTVAVRSVVSGNVATDSINRLFLYRLVFASRSVTVATLLLLVVFLLQPLHHVFADEGTAENASLAEEEVALFADTPEEASEAKVEAPAPVSTSQPSSTENTEESAATTVEEEIAVPSTSAADEDFVPSISTTSDTVATEGTVPPAEGIATSASSTSTASQEPLSESVAEEESFAVSSSTATTTVASSSTASEVVPSNEPVTETDSPTPLPDVPASPPTTDEPEPVLEDLEVSTTTLDEYEEVGVPAPSFYHVGGNDSELVFLNEQCTKVGDDSFYCQKQAPLSDVQDSLTALPDADGDLEIFLIRDGRYAQLTENVVDDSAPFYDPASESIVWQRLIGEYYHVISYDLETGEEQQLTSGETNNMEPKRDGKYVTWQRWVDGYWHVMVSNGSAERQITTTMAHNMAPHIRGHLVIWSVHHSNGHRELQTYDMKTDTYTTIGDSDDVSVINPRLMMVYEAVYSNGDSIMRGYDMLTGTVVPLQALPRQLPEDIPDTDTTGETRALIQNKPSLKEAEIESESGTPTTTPPVPPPATTTDSYTLDLAVSGASTTEPLPNFTATEFDLHIPPLEQEPLLEIVSTSSAASSSTQIEGE